MGGYVARAFAEKYPGLAAGLGLFHSSALPDTEEDAERRARNRTFLEQHGVAAFADEFLQPQLSPTHREYLVDPVAQLQRLAAAVLPAKTHEESLLPDYCTVPGCGSRAPRC